jgi:hypothetical protein
MRNLAVSQDDFCIAGQGVLAQRRSPLRCNCGEALNSLQEGYTSIMNSS